MKLTLVGEAPGRSGSGITLGDRAGRKLADLLEIPVPEFLASTSRINMLNVWPGYGGKGTRFPLAAACEAFQAWLPYLAGKRVVFLGRTALVLARRPAYFEWVVQHYGLVGFTATRFPHPSGLNRMWNDPLVRDEAAAFLRTEWAR